MAIMSSVHTQITQAEYFVDTDPGIGNGVSIDISSGFEVSETFAINTEGLEDGMHTLYVRTKEAGGAWSVYDKQLFYISTPVNQTDIIHAEYYVDSDPGSGNGNPVVISGGLTVNENFTIDTDELEPGMHALYLRVQDAEGFWSLYDKQTFYLSPPPNDSEISIAEYFVDLDPGFGNGTPIPVSEGILVDENINIETDGLDIGAHTLYVRVMDLQGSWTLYDKQLFRIQEAGPIITAEYFFDMDPGEGNGIELIIDPGFNVYEQVELSAEGLEVGIHELFVRVMDNDDIWSEVDTAEFEVLTVSVNEFDFSFAVFPNPTSDLINVNAQVEIEEMFIHDINGRQVAYRNGNHNRIEVNHLATGTYILTVRTNSSTHQFTFIKE